MTAVLLPLLLLPGVPYDLSPEFVQELFTKHKIDYIIHGDDPCLLPDGTDAYAHAKKLGRFKMVRLLSLCMTVDRCLCMLFKLSVRVFSARHVLRLRAGNNC